MLNSLAQGKLYGGKLEKEYRLTFHLSHIYKNKSDTFKHVKYGFSYIHRSLHIMQRMQYSREKMESRTCRDTTLTLSKWMCPLGSVTAGFA